MPPRLRRSPDTVFTHVFIAIILLGFVGVLKSVYHPTPASDHINALRSLEKRDLACRLVHSSSDQCAFVKANCPDEESGLISYLQLYYCSLANVKWLAFIILTIWTCVLFSTIGIAASDFLCLNLSTIATVIGMSESLAGVTLLAFGNGSADVFSTFAAFSSHSGSLAVGELMGAAGFITSVVAGSMAITKPFRVAKKAFVRDVAFFAVAAGFSLHFLKDGHLRMWECSVMVAFYLTYVLFVMVWHWYFDRRRKRRQAENAARSHQHIPNQQELDMPHYEDDEESRPTTERAPLIRTASGSSVNSSYRPSTPAWAIENMDEIDDEMRDHYLAALSSNMRVNRPSSHVRTASKPIRPSLVGALEFRAVLNALERRSTNTQPIYMRRYSDEGRHMLGRIAESEASLSDTALTSDSGHGVDIRQSVAGTPGRVRAVSANDAWMLGIQRNLLDDENGTPETAIYAPLAELSSSQRVQVVQNADQQHNQNLLQLPSQSAVTSGTATPVSMTATRNGLLAPPDMDFRRPEYKDDISRHASGPISPGGLSPFALVPKLHIPQDGSRQPQELRFTESPAAISSPRSHSPSVFHLPPASMSPESSNNLPLSQDRSPKRMVRWWPYKYLPGPDALGLTLFPGMNGWTMKTWPDRILAVCTAPSIFILTVTVPVVEEKSGEDVDVVEETIATPRPDSASPLLSPALVRLPSAPSDHHARTHGATTVPQITTTHTDEGVPAKSGGWARWLAAIQAFTAPLCVVCIIWANLDEQDTSLLIKMILGSLIFSLLALALLLTVTTADKEPKHKPVLCFMGFFVAVAWISTIATEVVGVLKTFGVILNMSDAILGLTIFAVGNSLGDLVADITVARLGYPVMALSACFGGPMLNILLGIGIGGLYQTIMHARHVSQKHPDRPIVYKPYDLEISSTLLISGATLVVTLVFLLIIVPLNNWRMDRKIGIGLIGIWCTCTLVNVILEVLGVGQSETSSFGWI